MITIQTLRNAQVHALINAWRALNTNNVKCLSVAQLFSNASDCLIVTPKQCFNALQQMCALGLFVRLAYNQYALTDKGRAVALEKREAFVVQIKNRIEVERANRARAVEKYILAQKEFALCESLIRNLNKELSGV